MTLLLLIKISYKLITSHTTGPTSLNEFNNHDEAVNTTRGQPGVLNPNINQPTENIINTFHNNRTTPLRIVNDQPSVSNDEPINSRKLIKYPTN